MRNTTTKTRLKSTPDTSQSSIFYELHKSELEQVSDDSINSAYNFFDAERMKYYHGVYVSTKRNFRRKRDEKPEEWNNFASVIRICKRNNFHLRCYIKYCFINCLVPRGKGKALSDISYLRNYPQIIKYSKDKANIERLYSVYMSIMKSIMLVKKLSKSRSEDTRDTIKNIISSGKLTEYISTGTVSAYFLSMIPNINVIIKKYSNSANEDGTVLNDICSRIETYGSKSISALNMFYPSSMNKNIVELCS